LENIEESEMMQQIARENLVEKPNFEAMDGNPMNLIDKQQESQKIFRKINENETLLREVLYFCFYISFFNLKINFFWRSEKE
jgi:hypothetical protein